MNLSKPLRLGMDRKDPSGEFIPNGISEKSRKYPHWIQKTGEFGHQFCHQPFLTVLKNLGPAVEIDLCNQFIQNDQPFYYYLEATQTNRAWLTEKGHQNFSPWPHFKKESLEAINKGKAKLLIAHFTKQNDTPTGDFYQFGLFENLYLALKRAGICPSQVIYLGQAPDPARWHQEYLKKSRPDKPLALVKGINYFEMGWGHYFRKALIEDNNYLPKREQLNTGKSHRYLLFNHEPRSHRRAFLSWVFENNLQDLGLISFRDEKKALLYEEDIHHFQSKSWQQYLERFNQLKSHLPLIVDQKDNFHISNHTKWPFEKTSFSMITERASQFHNGTHLVTPKAYKCFSQFHPFLILGPRHCLKVLQDLGYQTFSKWFDESYDEVASLDERATKVANEFQRICELSDTNFYALMDEMYPVLEHNYQHFISRLERSEIHQVFYELITKQEGIE